MKVALIRRRLYQQGLSVDPDNVRILMSLASMHRQLSDNEVRLEPRIEGLGSVIIECDTYVTFLKSNFIAFDRRGLLYAYFGVKQWGTQINP